MNPSESYSKIELHKEKEVLKRRVTRRNNQLEDTTCRKPVVNVTLHIL